MHVPACCLHGCTLYGRQLPCQPPPSYLEVHRSGFPSLMMPQLSNRAEQAQQQQQQQQRRVAPRQPATSHFRGAFKPPNSGARQEEEERTQHQHHQMAPHHGTILKHWVGHGAHRARAGVVRAPAGREAPCSRACSALGVDLRDLPSTVPTDKSVVFKGESIRIISRTHNPSIHNDNRKKKKKAREDRAVEQQ